MNNRAKGIIEWLNKNYFEEGFTQEEAIAKTYNRAMDDAKEFIEVMIKNNPECRLCLERLLITMFPGLLLGDNTK